MAVPGLCILKLQLLAHPPIVHLGNPNQECYKYVAEAHT